MRSYIVTVDSHDQLLWSEIVKRALPDQEVVVLTEYGKYNAVSVAETLAFYRKAVAFVVDAGTSDPARVRVQARELEGMFASVPNEMWRVEQFVPEMERCFFADPGIAAAIFEMDVTQRALVEYAPRKVFLELAQARWRRISDAYEQFFAALSPRQWELLQRDPTISAVLGFLKTVNRRSSAA